MLKIKRKTLLIWTTVLAVTIILNFFTYRDTYLNFYWLLLFALASICVFSINRKIVNTLTVFSAFYAALFAFGPMMLYRQGLTYYNLVGTYILVAYFCFVIGYYFNKGKTFTHKTISAFIPSDNSKTIHFISLCVFVVGMAGYSAYFITSWSSIFVADLENGRVEAMTGKGLYLWLGSLVWLAVYMVFEQSLLTGKYKKTVYAMFSIAAVFSILLGFRSALVNPILVMFFMKNKKREIPIRKMIALVIALFAFIGIYGAIRSGNGSSLDSLLNEFKVSSVNLNNILITFPYKVGFQYGKTYFLDIIQLFDNSIVGTTSWLKTVLNLSFSGGGVTPTLIGEFYINWGLFGSLIGMMVTGSIFKSIDRSYHNQINSIFLSSLILGYIRPIIRGGIANSSVTLLVYVVGYCICQYIAKKLKVK